MLQLVSISLCHFYYLLGLLGPLQLVRRHFPSVWGLKSVDSAAGLLRGGISSVWCRSGRPKTVVARHIGDRAFFSGCYAAPFSTRDARRVVYGVVLLTFLLILVKKGWQPRCATSFASHRSPLGQISGSATDACIHLSRSLNPARIKLFIYNFQTMNRSLIKTNYPSMQYH